MIVPYRSGWAEQYLGEAARLATAMAGVPHEVEHVGSTSVPGLAAKPIIDVLLGVGDLSLIDARVGELAHAGFEYVARYQALLPRRRYFRRVVAGERRCHLHAVRRGGRFWTDHLLFREQLRAHPALAAEYGELKRRLAASCARDGRDYTLEKSPFISAVVAAARRQHLGPERTPPCVLFDWGDTIMRDLPDAVGPMEHWPRVEAIEGAVEALDELRTSGYLTGLATNAADSDESAIWRALARVGLETRFDHVFCARGLGAAKPDRAYFDAILEQLGLAAGEVIMVGDSRAVDVEGAVAAGLGAVWFGGSQPEPVGERVAVVAHLSCVPAAVERLHAGAMVARRLRRH